MNGFLAGEYARRGGRVSVYAGSAMDEKERIALLARTLAPRAPGHGIEVGIGDDAAVLDPRDAPGRLVWTIDEQVDGTHFERGLLSWHDVGWRSLMAAASDVAAMGAEPWCALSALVLPDDFGDEALGELARGQADAADALGAPVVGGNLARGPALSIATTLLGTCASPVARGGARAGDVLWMAGAVGLSAAGLLALRRGCGDAPGLAHAVEAWRRPRALVDAGRAMSGLASAAVDVSDGLARDVGHVAEASAVRVVLDGGALGADAALARAAEALGVSALDLALYGGEDYALVAASPSPIPGFRRIGEVRAGEGLALRTSSGEQPLEPRGFDHFRTSTPRATSRS
jgi:thiamine-monophosphate kinase